MEKILAVVVTYNRKKLLVKSLEKLMQQTKRDFDILVVDNASTDGTCMELKNSGLYDAVRYVNTGKNLGGAGGFSLGIEWGANQGYHYVWVMDDDTMPQDDALEKLWYAHKKLEGNYGFLSSYAKWTDGNACIMNMPAIQGYSAEEVDLITDNILRVKSASFVSMFIPISVVQNVGLPIKEFFIWGDDVEYSLRISKLYNCYFVYNSVVIHEMKTNVGTTIYSPKEKRLDRYRFLYRNKLYIAKKNSKRDVLNFFLDMKNDIKKIRSSECIDKKQRCRIVVKSAIRGLVFNPPICFPKGNEE